MSNIDANSMGDFDPEDYEGIQQKMATIPRAQVRKWERQAKEAEDLRAQIAQLRREQAFYRAGIPVDDPAARYFVRAYDGDIEDLDALRAAAIEARVLQPPEAQTQAINQALAGNQAAVAAASGAQTTGPNQDLKAALAEIRNTHRGATSNRDGALAVARLMDSRGHVPVNSEGTPFGRR